MSTNRIIGIDLGTTNSVVAVMEGDKPIVITPQWGRSARVAIRQTYPLPMTVLAILPELEVGG